MKTDIQKRISELNNKQIEIDNELKRLYLQEELQTYEEHKKYVGKCYKLGSKYYKVISQYAINNCNLTCLKFDVNSQVKMLPDSGFDLEYCYYDFVEINSVFVFGNSNFFDKAIEIDDNEFYEAMDNYYKKFIKQINNVTKILDEQAEQTMKIYGV